MGYHMEYEPEKNNKYPSATTGHRKNCGRLFAIMLLLGLLAVGYRYREKVVAWLIPGDDEITSVAAETLIDDLRAGVPAGEAVTAFCEEIIANGK